jgi:hypothetical protein
MHQKYPTFFKDKNGKVVLWQFPNALLFAWIFIVVVALLFQHVNPVKHGIDRLASAVLFVWAYQEVMTGVNYFRRALGLVVIGIIVYGFFA